jgi:hypothetical protein
MNRAAPRQPQVRQDAADGPAEDGGGGNSDEDEFEEPEGYKHFCEHFRINPGSRCTECSKCDLYQAEDEEAVARNAGEKAEREWLSRQGESEAAKGTNASASISAMGLRNVNQDLSACADGSTGGANRSSNNALWDLGPGKPWSYWLKDVWVNGRWKLECQVFVDWVVEQVVVIDEL